MLHRIWQRTGRLPSEIMSLSKGEKAFVFASEKVQIEYDAKHPPMRL